MYDLRVKTWVDIKHTTDLVSTKSSFYKCVSMKIKASGGNNKLYKITISKDFVIIDSCEPPIIKVYYNPQTQIGNLLSCSTYTKQNFLEKQIMEAVRKAIEFARESIICK